MREKLKRQEMIVGDIPRGGYFLMIDLVQGVERIYYMRRMKRNPRPFKAINNNLCAPIQNYGFIQGYIDHFDKNKPSHGWVDIRYKGFLMNEKWELPEKKKKRGKYKIKPHIYQGAFI